MNEQINKYLTEAMGGVWLPTLKLGMVKGPSCKESTTTDFFTWPGFGKLWEWAQQQEWFETFQQETGNYGMCWDMRVMCKDYVNPTRFAIAVYSFLVARDE